MDKPGLIYNVDELGCQLNNKNGYVIAEQGSKNITSIISAEKGETITIIACCNAEGNFLPPACVFKGKNKKAEFEDGMPPGSVEYMCAKSAYVNSDIFFIWLKEHFSVRKPPGNVLLILDGHSSHCNNIEMLEYAADNEIILLCLPPHTTQFLQPLDRAFFKSFKLHFYEACNLFIKSNPTRKINRLQFGNLLSKAWGKAANTCNGVSAFSATGIYPFNPDVIPDYAFISVQQNSESMANERLDDTIPNREIMGSTTPPQQLFESPTTSPQPSNITPGKLLNIISPVPSTSSLFGNVTLRKQHARVLTSIENITKIKQKKLKRSLNQRRKHQNKILGKRREHNHQRQICPPQKKNKGRLN